MPSDSPAPTDETDPRSVPAASGPAGAPGTDEAGAVGRRLGRLAARHGDRFSRLCFRLAAVASLFVALFPLYFLLIVGLTPHLEVWHGVDLLPGRLSPEGLYLALRRVDWTAAFANSAIIAVLTTLLVLAVAVPAGYVFGRLEFPGRWPAFVAVLLFAAVPPQAVAIPLYEAFITEIRAFGLVLPGLYDTHAAVVLPTGTLQLPLAVGLLTVFFAGIPDELEGAARVAGATRLEALRYVILPLARPGVASVATLVFVETYTEYFFTSFMTRSAGGAGTTVSRVIHNWLHPFWQLAYPNAVAVAGLVGLVPSFLVILYASGKLDSWLSAWESAAA